MAISTDKNKIEEVLTRGVENIYPSKEFLEKRLKAGEKLTLYLGIDPTGPNLHLGHAIPLMKLRQLQDLGHEIILLIGDFTGMIGDPTDKSAVRKKLTRNEVLENCKNYKKQATKIIDIKKVQIKYNSKWLDKMSFGDVLELASQMTVQQLLARDMFKRRFRGEIVCKQCGSSNLNPYHFDFDGDATGGGYTQNVNGALGVCKECNRELSIDDEIKTPKPIFLHEFMYPLMQGYDSVAMDVDGEVGGNDQTFNMLVGRDLMKTMKHKEKFVLTMKLLTDPTGQKMGKTTGNMIALGDSADEMFGKVMSWPDEMIVSGFELITKVSMVDVDGYKKKLESGANPRDIKIELAKEVVKTFIGEAEAQEAEKHFIKVISNKEQPDEIEEKPVVKSAILDVLLEIGLAGSKSDARRLVDQKGVKVNDAVVSGYDFQVKDGDVIQKGKRFFVRVKR